MSYELSDHMSRSPLGSIYAPCIMLTVLLTPLELQVCTGLDKKVHVHPCCEEVSISPRPALSLT